MLFHCFLCIYKIETIIGSIIIIIIIYYKLYFILKLNNKITGEKK